MESTVGKIGSWILVETCCFVTDDKGPSDRMVGYYYCWTHQVRTTRSDRPCLRARWADRVCLRARWADLTAPAPEL